MFHQRQFVFRRHAAGNVYQKHQIRRRQFFSGQVFGLNSDFDHFGIRLPRGIHCFGMHGKRPVILRQRIVVIKIIDQFFNAHCIFWRQTAALVKETADIGIAAGIYIDAEG